VAAWLPSRAVLSLNELRPRPHGHLIMSGAMLLKLGTATTRDGGVVRMPDRVGVNHGDLDW